MSRAFEKGDRVEDRRNAGRRGVVLRVGRVGPERWAEVDWEREGV